MAARVGRLSAYLNIYEALELPPTETDPGRLEARLNEKLSEWSMALVKGTRAQKRTANRFKPRESEIRAVLHDPTQLSDHAEARRRQLEEAEKSEQERRHNVVRTLLADHDAFTPQDVSALAPQLRLTEAETSALLRKLGYSEEKRETAAPLEQLDKVTARNLFEALDTRRERDLYEFLGAGYGPGSSSTDLVAAADRRFTELNKSGRSTPDVTAGSTLAGLSRKIFRDPAMRRAYETTVALRALSLPKFDDALQMAGSDGVITAGQLDRLVEIGRELKVPENLVVAYILQRAADQGQRVQRQSGSARAKVRTCPMCLAVTAPGDEACGRCGRPVELACRSCDRRQDSANEACTKCGAPVAALPALDASLQRAIDASRAGDVDSAQTELEYVLRVFPGYARARKLADQVRSVVDERRRQVSQIQQLVTERRGFEASQILATLPRGGDDLERLRRQTDVMLRRAEGSTKRGERAAAARRADAAVTAFEEALGVVSDYPAALQGLARTPPGPVRNVRAAQLGDLVRVTWQPRDGGSHEYQVVRREGAAPRSTTDGVAVGATSGSQMDDDACPIGVPCHYAVFTTRRGVASAPAHAPEPVICIGDVSKLRARASQGRVMLTWEPPAHAESVEVWAKPRRAPARRGDGTQVSATRDSATHTNLKNDVQVYFLVCAGFRVPGRTSLQWSQGVVVSGTPSEPPPPIDRLWARAKDGIAFAEWTPPTARGVRVEVRLSPDDTSRYAGRMISVRELDRLGKSIVVDEAEGEGHSPLPSSGVGWLAVVTRRGSSARVGPVERVVDVPPVTNLRGQVGDHEVVLEWTWPPGIDMVAVAVSADKPAKRLHERGVTVHHVTRGVYDRHQGWVQSSPAGSHFAVFARGATEDAWSSPAPLSLHFGPTKRVQYHVRLARAWLVGGVTGAELVLETEEPAVINGVLVVASDDHTPLEPGAGEVIEELDGVQVDGMMSVPLPASAAGTRRYVTLFHKGAGTGGIRLLPASREQRTLG